MYWNDLKLGVRRLRRSKIFTAINFLGLSLGMGCFLMLSLIVRFEYSFDDFHLNGDRIYQMVRENSWENNTEARVNTGAPLAPLLRREFASIQDTVRMTLFRGSFVNVGDRRFRENKFFFADPSLLRVFTFPLLRGDPDGALKHPFTVVLTPQTAVRLFGDQDPIHATLTYTLNGSSHDFLITGIMQDIPRNSHLDFDFVASYSSLPAMLGEAFMTRHWDSPTWTYVMLRKGVSPQSIDSRLSEFSDKFVDKWSFSSVTHRLLPLEKIYFESPGPHIGRFGAIQYMRIMIVIAAFLLAIACVNAINLSTAQSVMRSKEIGVRKVIGAGKSQLIRQFLGESLGFTFLSLGGAALITGLLLPSILKSLGFQAISGRAALEPGFLAVICGTIMFVGIGSGFYPAVVLSSCHPASAIKSMRGGKGFQTRIRKTLVIFQFSISIALIIIVMLFSRQLDFLRNHAVGFSKENMIVIPIRDYGVRDRFDLLKARLARSSRVISVTAASIEPGVTDQNGIGMRWRDKEKNDMGIIYVDPDFLKVLEIPLAVGRDFSAGNIDAASSLLINQTAFKMLEENIDLEDDIELFYREGGKRIPVDHVSLIGIVEDFHFRSMSVPMQPILMRVDSSRYRYILIRISSRAVEEAISGIKQVWESMNFEQPFEFTFLSDDMRRVFRRFQSLAEIMRIGTGLAVLIACMGLFGLAAFSLLRRRKEIAIRKILGATAPGLVRKVSGEFLLLVSAANLIAWPSAYWAVNNFLQKFPYRISIDIGIFIAAATLAITSALATVIILAVKTALANPSETLRYE